MTHSYFNDNLAERDPLIFKALQDEKNVSKARSN